ncbi:MAG: helix-turn-helix transcriptional regulator [Alphaproteobacteria bacterium]|jgi:transcriptional regulator with XRE-family HTH domain|uniref:helix-turn-helix domain-containing protein n=1 Tax=Pacificispira sp. TaxID=2888761 RepID=UPI001B0BAFAA|nr:helix-turn-helix transcriptional regulator [Alphaproteobacteria bacterium]MBO6861742.1 helix-turn-helix transcriptional regulator [Alphaproteobacteria bacterium]MEC9266822.1 helix-turn-helix transcriptional regulator [Pseudomonadota bacterium]
MAHPVDVAVGNRVRELRTRAGLSQTDLGLKLGVSFQQVQKYEKGVNRMGASRLIQICEALKVTVNDIFDGIASVTDATDKTLADPEAMRIARDIQRIENESMRTAVKQLVRTMSRL